MMDRHNCSVLNSVCARGRVFFVNCALDFSSESTFSKKVTTHCSKFLSFIVLNTFQLVAIFQKLYRKPRETNTFKADAYRETQPINGDSPTKTKNGQKTKRRCDLYTSTHESRTARTLKNMQLSNIFLRLVFTNINAHNALHVSCGIADSGRANEMKTVDCWTRTGERVRHNAEEQDM